MNCNPNLIRFGFFCVFFGKMNLISGILARSASLEQLFDLPNRFIGDFDPFFGENLIFLAKISFYWRLGNYRSFLPVFEWRKTEKKSFKKFFHSAKFPLLVLLLFTCG
ncbi:hypothetical protein METH109765_22390 [Mesobacillus thioparans]